jgi:hypothetical protein
MLLVALLQRKFGTSCKGQLLFTFLLRNVYNPPAGGNPQCTLQFAGGLTGSSLYVATMPSGYAFTFRLLTLMV